MVYKKCGVTQFLFMGWPDLEEMRYFGSGVLPLVRAAERELHRASVLAVARSQAEA
jgi:alkanesulfonate monooxygenase